MATADGFADTLIQGIESRFGVNEAAEAVVAAYEDAAVGTVVDSVAGLEHRAPTRKGAVVADKVQLRTLAAGRMRVEAGHLAGVLLALDEGDGIFPGRDLAVGVFEGVADAGAVDGEMAVGVFTLGLGSLDYDIHDGFALTVNSTSGSRFKVQGSRDRTR